MERNFENVKRNIILLCTDDVIKNEEFKAKVRVLDRKVQRMLMWSTLCAVWSYLILIVTIARIYANFNGRHLTLLLGIMLVIYGIMGWLIYFVWKGMDYNKSCFHH